MKKRHLLRTIAILAVLLLTVAATVVKIFLWQIASSEEFKKFAEQRASEYLHAKVSIGRIRPYNFNQLALENVIIELPVFHGGSQLVRLDRILFRYHLNQLWKGRFETPAGVTFRNPSLVIEADEFPYQYFETTANAPAGLGIPSLDFKGGEIRYLISSFGKDIVLRDIEGRIVPAEEFRMQIDIRATASGILDGSVKVSGLIDPVKKTHDLWIQMENMNFSRDIPLPFKALTGKVHWTGKDLVFEDVQTTLHGWSGQLSGSFMNQNGCLRTELRLTVGKEKPWIRAGFNLNLSEQKIRGDLNIPGMGVYGFQSTAVVQGKRFMMDSLMINNTYAGRGELDFATGNYQVELEKESKRISVFSNLRGLDFAIRGKLDHLNFLGLDIVTQGRVYIHAITSQWQDRQFRFKGDVETDYFILNQEPLQDLKGSFEITPYGISGVHCTWGRKFDMTGQITVPFKDPGVKLTIRAADFDLEKIQFFASKPLPKELGGSVDGKLLIEGELKHPEIVGVFNIRDGKWGKLDYDRGIIQFRGFPPYFPLYESKIWKGRSVFFLTGAIDLTLDNMVAGVKIETLDRLVIWKGIEVTLHEKEASVQLGKVEPGEMKPISSVEVGAVRQPKVKAGEPEENKPQETGFTVGTSVKF